MLHQVEPTSLTWPFSRCRAGWRRVPIAARSQCPVTYPEGWGPGVATAPAGVSAFCPLEMFERLQERDFDSEGRCCELSGDLAEASRRYERAGTLAKALRSARSVPDLARATDLARTLAAADLPTLEWLADVRRVLGSRPVAEATAALTAAEHTALARDVESALAAARPKTAPLETRAGAGGRPRAGRGHGGK